MIPIYDLPTAQHILQRPPLNLLDFPTALLARTAQLFGEGITPPQAVAQILESVRREGDTALRRWSQLLDRAELTDFRIPSAQLKTAFETLTPALSYALQTAAQRIRAFHQLQPLPNWTTQTLGGRLGQRAVPVDRAGIYVPGGSAPLPSSLLMAVIPAQVAGVSQLIVCTPPNPHPAILAAAHICGIEDVFQIGGAQAIAAMTFGTESIPKVDKIAGAGNIFVTLAKQQVYGTVGIDGLYGPTETVVIADHTANPAWVAADLLAQAEHDPLASAILLTPDRPFAEAVQVEIGKQMETLSRADIIAQSLSGRGGLVLVPDLDTAAEVANAYAPEHLCLAVKNPQALAGKLRHAGGLFIGERSFEVLGDYIAGPSHVMPTGGTARFASPLNVMDFVKIVSIIELDDTTSQTLSPLAAEIAQIEGLTAHANASMFRTSPSNLYTEGTEDTDFHRKN
ncbi:MAG: histidinol dehydrogenase [Anaerolineales bacterium]